MSHFHDRFKQHPVHTVLAELIGAIGSAEVKLEDPQQIAGYERFRRVLDFAKRCLDAIDPELVTEHMLNQIQGELANMKAHHESFVSSKDWNHLNQPADQLLNQLHLLPRSELPDGDRRFAEALEAFQAQAVAYLERVNNKAEAIASAHEQVGQKTARFENKLDEFDQRFEQQKGRIDTLINEQQGQFSQTQNDRQTKFTEQQTQLAQTNKERLDQLEQQRAQSKQEGDTLLSEIRQRGDKAMQEGQQKLDTVRAELETKSAETRETLQKQLDEAVRIVGLIGNTGLTGNYQRIANEQGRFANLFRWVAIACMGLAVFFVVIVVFSIGKDTFSWEVALFRLLGALTFSIPGLYCARESTRHRTVEQRNRRIELELASLSPYLAELTDEERKKIVGELSKQYFGRDAAPMSEDEILRKVKHMKGEDVMKFLERVAKVVKP